MVDYCRFIELMGYSREAFDTVERFEYLPTESGVLCSEEMCPDTSDDSLRIAWLFALGEYEEAEKEYDVLRAAEYMKEIQGAL